MIKEYIDNLIEENNEKLDSLEKQMNRQMSELESNRRQLELLQREQRMDINIFSPRSFNASSRQEIETLQGKVEKTSQEVEYTRELMETHVKKKSEYAKLSAEMNSLSDFLSDLYTKTELCLAVVYSDKNKCKTELKSMKNMIRSYAEKIKKEED